MRTCCDNKPNQYIDISEIEAEEYDRAADLLARDEDGNIIVVEKPEFITSVSWDNIEDIPETIQELAENGETDPVFTAWLEANDPVTSQILQEALADYVKLQSDTTQIIDSNIALATGKKLLLVRNNGVQVNAVSLGSYNDGSGGILEQLEFGSETEPFVLNHSAVSASDGLIYGKTL